MSAARRAVIATPALALALGLAGCGNGGDAEEPQETETVTEEAQETETDGSDADENGEQTEDAEEPDATETVSEEPSETATETEEADDSEASDDETSEDETSDDGSSSDDNGSDSLAVDSTGQGPMGLSTSESPDGDATEASGKLIVGPGSCFSLQPQDQPQLIVFGDDADFEVGQGQPAVTTDDMGTVSVGDQIDFSAVEYSQDELSGIPQQCANGAADTVLVVSE